MVATDGSHPLAGRLVVVTRPPGQGGGLIDAIARHGGQAVHCPAIVLEAVAKSDSLAAARDTQWPFDLAIFVSSNAVRFGLPLLRSVEPEKGTPFARQLAAVGPATADALAAAGYRDLLLPAARHDSEGLLAHPSLQRVKDARILLVQGEAGRPLLLRTLAARGARVLPLTCYRRRCAKGHQARLDPLGSHPAIHPGSAAGPRALLTLTSVAITDCWWRLCRTGPPNLLPWLHHAPTAVLSERIAKRHRQLGGRGSVAVADQASDAGMLKVLTRLADSDP